MTQQFSLLNKSGIVTGAASGIGRATALYLAEMGAGLTLVDLDAEGLKQVAAQIETASGITPYIVTANICDEAAVKKSVQAACSHFGTIDFLVNCAGILRRNSFLEIETEEWDLVMNTNLRAQFVFCQEVLRLMKDNGRGVIVNVASLAGRTCSLLGGAHYTTAKHALVGLSRHLAREFAPHGIRVNAFCPGATLTSMVEANTSQEELDAVAAATPRGHWADPIEQAHIIGFLVSDASANIVGACIDSNGGALMV